MRSTQERGNNANNSNIVATDQGTKRLLNVVDSLFDKFSPAWATQVLNTFLQEHCSDPSNLSDTKSLSNNVYTTTELINFLHELKAAHQEAKAIGGATV